MLASTRARYFQHLDRARLQVAAVVDPLFVGNGQLNAALPTLRAFRSELERRALEENLLAHAKTREKLARAREILQRLGWIREWIDSVRCRVGKPSGRVARVLAELGVPEPALGGSGYAPATWSAAGLPTSCPWCLRRKGCWPCWQELKTRTWTWRRSASATWAV